MLETEKAYERAQNLLKRTPGFWEAANEFSRQIVAAAANKGDWDERPEDVRGVNPDRSSRRFQGAAMVPRGDIRLRQSDESAARMWVVRETASL